ncbi:MAG TPA: EAL domain-containing protein, partial [Anaeromyxobacteraceae bacterium]|nr:EAL domain-containing protein [Anaeromyxobacteraceae bacterium]
RRPVSGELELEEARAVLDQGLYWTEYQPLLETRSERVIGYEALARFQHTDGSAISTGVMFGILHADPGLLARAELALKRIQLARAPAGELFVNLDPDCWVRAGAGEANPFLALLSSSPVRLVVELIEHMRAADAVLARQVATTLRRRGIPIALDDIGAVDALVSFSEVAEAEVLKFDRSVLGRLANRRHRALVEALIRMARANGTRTVLEGVETTQDLASARDLGVDLVQGFLFAERHITTRQ